MNIYYKESKYVKNVFFKIYNIQAEEPGVARGKNFFFKYFGFLAYNTPRLPNRGAHKKFQPDRSSRLEG